MTPWKAASGRSSRFSTLSNRRVADPGGLPPAFLSSICEWSLVAAAVCAEQVIDLIDHGVEDLHFYTMNRADLVFAICHLIGLRAKSKVAAEAA